MNAAKTRHKKDAIMGLTHLRSRLPRECTYAGRCFETRVGGPFEVGVDPSDTFPGDGLSPVVRNDEWMGFQSWAKKCKRGNDACVDN